MTYHGTSDPKVNFVKCQNTFASYDNYLRAWFAVKGLMQLNPRFRAVPENLCRFGRTVWIPLTMQAQNCAPSDCNKHYNFIHKYNIHTIYHKNTTVKH